MEFDTNQVLSIQKQLEAHMGAPLNLKINDNRSTMLSIKWEPGCAKVSLHRMFLEAPQNVVQDVACYLKKKNNKLAPSIKAYIETNLQRLDYSHELDLSKLDPKGIVYDLKKIYDNLNAEYFNHSLNLHITWFGKKGRTPKSRLTFGLYHDPLRLIKINRIMDQEKFPEYFVSFVIFHEMLHHVCPAYVDENGAKHIHGKEFKKREKQFRYYDLAEQWIEDHRHQFFEGSF